MALPAQASSALHRPGALDYASVINALLATGFDWRAGVWQALEIVIGMAVYLPFMKISEKAIAKQEALAEQNA